MTGPRLLKLLAAVAGIAAVVWLLASLMVPPESRRAVAIGVGVGAAWQALVLAVTLTALGHNRLAAFGVGMLARFLLVAVAALVALPALGVPMGPALLSMVTVLFATTLIEPVLFAAGAGTGTGR
ncbi:MAG TPA: hypothetical protein VM890_10730 [Longimicrobium sp.]|jgi:hypothetical protein|nr:hypothetical protein [Longimicrobium sp.]